MPEEKQSAWQGRLTDWGRLAADRSFFRAEVDEVLFGLDRQSLVLVRGCRGTGKSTVLKLAARRLLERGMARDDLLFVDLEDPVWAPWSGPGALLDVLEQAPHADVLLLDGVERLPSWVDLSRRLRATRRLAILAAASGQAALPAPAGVHGVPLWPLALPAWIQEFTGKRADPQHAESTWREYLTTGGLPVARRENERRKNLLDLFFSALMRDVVLMQPIRDSNALTAMAVHLLSHSGAPTSASRLKGTVTRSVDQARMFLSHLEAAGLVSLVSRLEDAGRQAHQAARLVFAADTGLAWALARESESGDGGLSGLALTAVFHQLNRMNKKVFSWKAGGRLGLAVGAPGRPAALLDVQIDEAAAVTLAPLAGAMERTGCETGILLVADATGAGVALAGPGSVEVIPIWSWLFNPRLGADELPTDIKVAAGKTALPKHLL